MSILARERWSRSNDSKNMTFSLLIFILRCLNLAPPSTKLPRCDRPRTKSWRMVDGYEHIRIDQQGFFRLAWQELGENPCKNLTNN
jgi:hypothetical protein